MVKLIVRLEVGGFNDRAGQDDVRFDEAKERVLSC